MKACLAASVALLGACTSHQEILLSIDTDVGIPCEIDHIRITAMSGSTSIFERDVSNARLPIQIKLQDETARGTFMLQIAGIKDGVEVLRSEGPLSFGSAGLQTANVVLESTCLPPEHSCSLPDLVPGSAPAAPLPVRVNCGASVRRYTKPAVSAELFRDVCTGAGAANSGAVLVGGKHGAEKIPLGDAVLQNFGFRFYGRPIRQIWASEDGYLSFELDNPDPMSNRDPGSLDRGATMNGVPPPPQSIMVFWDQLNLSPAGVCYALEGQAGAQKLRVTWSHVCQIMPCGTDQLNFTIVLDERTQRVSLTYGDMIASNTALANGGNATVGIVGIVNAAASCPASTCNVLTGLCGDGKACGYNQVFSKMVQAAPGLSNTSVAFEPVTEAQ